MNLSKHFFGSVLSIFVLTSCRVSPVIPVDDVQTVVDHEIESATNRIRVSQMRTGHARALDHLPLPIDPAGVSADETFSISWDGDALPLLKDLAAERNMVFTTIGPRLSLPVSVHVDKASLESVLQELRGQTAERASIDAAAAILTLQYVRVPH